MKKLALFALLILMTKCSCHDYDVVTKVHRNYVDNTGKYCVHLQHNGKFHTDKTFNVGDTITILKKIRTMKDKINTLLDLLQGTESVVFFYVCNRTLWKNR